MTTGWRSLLFVAADDQTRLERIASRGADAVILDLEDAVPPVRKASARAGLPSVIAALSGAQCAVVVRINASWCEALADLAVAVRQDVAAIMVPKVETGARLGVISEIVADMAREAGLKAPPGLIALVESPTGLAELDAIAQVNGVIGLAFGTEDFALALGVPPSREALELPVRLIALAAGRQGLMAFGLPVSIATIDDEKAWQAGVAWARAVGVTGALCIHPRQIAPVQQGFAPTIDELAAAERIVAAWESAGSPGAMLVDGKMIDRPVVLAARRVLSGNRADP